MLVTSPDDYRLATPGELKTRTALRLALTEPGADFRLILPL